MAKKIPMTQQSVELMSMKADSQTSIKEYRAMIGATLKRLDAELARCPEAKGACIETNETYGGWDEQDDTRRLVVSLTYRRPQTAAEQAADAATEARRKAQDRALWESLDLRFRPKKR